MPACVGILLLAAGFSRRMGQCKLLLPLGGQPVVAYLTQAVAELTAQYQICGPPVAVLNPEAPLPLRELLTTAGFNLVVAEKAKLGQAESLKAGLSALRSFHPQGVLTVLGDQPLVRSELLLQLCQTFEQCLTQGKTCCVAPSCAGRRGNPVVLHSALFDDISQLSGDVGARHLVAKAALHLVPWNDQCLWDLDTPEDYALFAQRFAPCPST